MLIVDDLLLSPYRGIKWIFNEIERLAEEEVSGEAERITQELSELYRKLDTGEITEEAFDEREQVLLDRLDAIEAEVALIGDEVFDDE